MLDYDPFLLMPTPLSALGLILSSTYTLASLFGGLNDTVIGQVRSNMIAAASQRYASLIISDQICFAHPYGFVAGSLEQLLKH